MKRNRMKYVNRLISVMQLCTVIIAWLGYCIYSSNKPIDPVIIALIILVSMVLAAITEVVRFAYNDLSYSLFSGLRAYVDKVIAEMLEDIQCEDDDKNQTQK